jgi:hypothetical protein
MANAMELTAPIGASLLGDIPVRGSIRSQYVYCHREHELLLTAREITTAQAEALERADADFALVIEEPAILLCARFGDAIPWLAAPFCWHGLPRESRQLPPAPHSPEERRALLQVTLSDSVTRRLRAVRNVTLWLDFTRSLHEAIRDQARTTFDPKEHERVLSRLRLHHPTVESLVASARVRCVGSP